MHIRTKLALYSISLILITGIALISGAAYLNTIQAGRQNQKRLQNAVESFESRFSGMVSLLDRHLLNYTKSKGNPGRVINEIYRMQAGEQIEPTDNPVPQNLINLGIASGVESYAYYFPTIFGGQDNWQYTYSPRHGGLFGEGPTGKNVLYRLSIHGFLAYREAPRPNLYSNYPSLGERYSFELKEDGTTMLVSQSEYLSPIDTRPIKKGGHIGTFILKKAFDTNWSTFDKEMGVYFNLFDNRGQLKGGQRPLPDLVLDGIQSSLGRMVERRDLNDETYDSILIPLQHRGGSVGYISANISQKVTVLQIQETIVLLFGIALTLLAMIALGAWVIVRKSTEPIINLSRISSELAAGNLELSVDTSRHDELGVLAYSIALLRDSIREKTQLLEENHLIIEQPVPKVQQDILPEPQTRKSEKTRIQTMLKNIHPIKKDRKWINIFEK